MAKLSPALLALAFVAGGCSASPPKPTAAPVDAGFVIMNATVFDGEGFRAGNVHVRGETIEGFVDAVPPGATVIDGRNHTLLPGLIDGHAHVGMAAEKLAWFTRFGVTTVVDLFGPPDLVGQLRATDTTADGVKRASLVGAGNLATAPGGHGTEYGVPIPTVERADQADAFVSARKQEGSQLLKIVFDTSVNDVGGKPSQMPTLSVDVVRSLVDAGHRAHLPVVVHTGGCDDIRKVVELGADVIAHGCALPEGDQLGKALAAKGVFFNPTLAVQLRPCGMEYWIPIVADPEMNERLTHEERERLGRDRKDHDKVCSTGRLRLVADAAKAGVRLIAGPDSPNRRIPFGASLLAEIDLLQIAGATVTQSLAAATSNPADAYHLADRGRIAKGKRADLLLVAGDVRATPRSLFHTRTVWKAGAVAFQR